MQDARSRRSDEMGRGDVERALRAMDDDETRERLGRGDYDAVSALDLTHEERTLIRDAASDYPEVAGFSFETFATFSAAGVHLKEGLIGESSPGSLEAWKWQLVDAKR
jgi:hypothetical protein